MKEVDSHDIIYSLIENPLIEIIQTLNDCGTIGDLGATVCLIIDEYCEHNDLDKDAVVTFLKHAINIIVSKED